MGRGGGGGGIVFLYLLQCFVPCDRAKHTGGLSYCRFTVDREICREICATVIPLLSEALGVASKADVHMTQLTNSLVPLVMVWCYEGGLGFCAKKACTLSLEYQCNVCIAQPIVSTENIFSGNQSNSFKLQAKQLDISDVVDCR